MDSIKGGRNNMKRITFWTFMALVCCIFSAPVHCLASDGMQPFVLVTDMFGSSNFSMSNGDGTLTEQQALVRYTGSAEDETYSNGIGDFDNDGVLDFVLAFGSELGIEYQFGKIVNNEFVPQGQMTGPDRYSYPAKMAVATLKAVKLRPIFNRLIKVCMLTQALYFPKKLI